MIIRAYHTANGDPRKRVIIPDTAHGTNPATVAMCGYEVTTVPSDERGGVDMEALRAALGPDVAAIMLTNPNTLGLFDENICEISAPRPRGRRARLLRRRQPERGHGHEPPGRHGLRRPAHQPAQDVLHAARRGRARAPVRCASRTSSPTSCPDRSPRATPTARSRWSRPRGRSAGCARSRATRACSSAPTRTCARRAPRGSRRSPSRRSSPPTT